MLSTFKHYSVAVEFTVASTSDYTLECPGELILIAVPRPRSTIIKYKSLEGGGKGHVLKAVQDSLCIQRDSSLGSDCLAERPDADIVYLCDCGLVTSKSSIFQINK